VGDPSHVDAVEGNSPEAQELRVLAESLAGISKNDLDRNKNLPPDVADVTNMGGGINGISIITMKDGRKFVLKSDSQREGSNAEDAISRMYHDLGLPMPMVRKINPDDKGPNGNMFLMQLAGPAVVPDAAGRATQGAPSTKRMSREHLREAFQIFVANSVMNNTDRHNGNIMRVDLVNGGERAVIIDNGLAMFHAGFGSKFKKNDSAGWTAKYNSPAEYAAGNTGGNSNVMRRHSTAYLSGMSDDELRAEITEFITRMRDRAAIVRFYRQEEADFISARAQWILDNIDVYMKQLKR
jgi:hypothetical protein